MLQDIKVKQKMSKLKLYSCIVKSSAIKEGHEERVSTNLHVPNTLKRA